ncbi:ARF-binding protein [Coemansia sp. RSA 552]|nr:ARF-binding protein [Coemansia sp. RSA 552]
MSFNLQNTLDDLFKPPSRLQSLVDRAVGPNKSEPDLALNLDICDLVTRKKGNYPHDVVFALLPYVNGRSNTQALLALTLLDNLVKNCGHAVHYQIGSREFLNELFKRFPEYQPAFPNPVHGRVLEMLQEWRVTLCQRSRYREDLQRINDMYALLCRKGWRFPRIDTDNVAVVLEPTDTLKTRDELEKEDMEAMQAKLQELLRRATPRDLREANKLMKIITGYEQSNRRRDYDQEWEEELQVLERKAALLTDILRSTRPGQRLDDTAQGLLAKCSSGHARLTKLISEHESIADGEDAPADEDSDQRQELNRLIRLSDLITEVETAAKDLKEGRTPTLRSPESPEAQNEEDSTGDKELISWDDDDNGATQQAAPPMSPTEVMSPMDDLAGLSFQQPLPMALPMTTHSAPLSPNASTPALGTAGNVQPKPMTNPSLPADSMQALASKQPETKPKGAFDFADLLAAAKSADSTTQSQRPPARASSAGPDLLGDDPATTTEKAMNPIIT